MQPASQDIFLVPHRAKFLLHAPTYGVTSLVNAATAAELQRWLTDREQSDLSAPARAIAQALVSNVPLSPTVAAGDFAPRQVSIMPTNDCNMRCLYCAPGAGSGDRSRMAPETCEAALRYQAEIVRRERYKCLAVYYFGGEPFIAWDLVKFCDLRAREFAEELGVPFWSSCTTNAFMAADRAEWVARHLTFALVSLDGPADVHDSYRPTKSGGATHGTVVRNLRIFEDAGMPYGLRCSVDRYVASRLEEITDYLCTEFRPVKINLEPLVLHGRSLESGLEAATPSGFVAAVMAAGKVARRHGVSLKLTTAQTERVAESNCAVAEDNFVVAPDGLVSSCYGANHRGSVHACDYAIGEVDPETKEVAIDRKAVEKVRGYAVSSIPRCRRCFCRWHCSGGCRLFHTPPGCTDEPGPMCWMTQKLTLWRILTQLGLFEEADSVSLEDSEVLA